VLLDKVKVERFEEHLRYCLDVNWGRQKQPRLNERIKEENKE